MIYQHRSMTCRRGKLHSRTELFAKTRLDNFESFGSPLIGSFETITGQDAFSIAWQYRQFESFEDWASQQREIAENKQKNATRKPSTLSPYIDEVDTFLLQLNEKCSPIQKDWENFLNRREFLIGSSLSATSISSVLSKNISKKAHIVIVGGGWGGLSAAKALRSLNKECNITLIDVINILE